MARLARGCVAAKPLASTGFLTTAFAGGALDSRYGRLVFVALCLCWLGEVLLIPDDEWTIRAGILSFLAGHLGADRGRDHGARRARPAHAALAAPALARDRFVARDFTNRAWGLPLYYAASLLLAMSVLS